jgi:hypothetical protein
MSEVGCATGAFHEQSSSVAPFLRDAKLTRVARSDWSLRKHQRYRASKHYHIVMINNQSVLAVKATYRSSAMHDSLKRLIT